MHRYVLGDRLGEGAFGDVRLARDKRTGEKVAVKTFKDKCYCFDDFTALPEVKALRSLSHPNIIECKQYIFEEGRQRSHLVFELMDMGSLERYCRYRKEPFSEAEIRSIFYQVIIAIDYMHSENYLHRDLKPENILLKSSGDGPHIVKLADLGLAKYIGRQAQRPQTTYVATRWYRSPEILLHLRDYGAPSDIWAIGAVMAEVVAIGKPLFPGANEDDQLLRVVALRGHPATVSWERGTRALRGRRDVPFVMPVSLRQYLRHASEPVLCLIESMLNMNPLSRPTASDALRSPLFHHSPARTVSDGSSDGYGRGILSQEAPASQPHPPAYHERSTDATTHYEVPETAPKEGYNIPFQEVAQSVYSYHTARDAQQIKSSMKSSSPVTRFNIPPVNEKKIELACNRTGLLSPAGCFKLAFTRDR